MPPNAAEQDPVQLAAGSSVATITLNRPASFNAIDLPMAQALGERVRQLAEHPATRVVIVRGAGRSFCSGGDIAAMQAHQADLPAFIAQIIDAFHAAILALQALPIPVITQVHGAAAGGGLSLALAGDLVLASADARFVVAYPQLGTSTDGGLSHRLTQRLGAIKAFEILTLQGRLSAEQALALGLVNAVVPAEQADAQALQWAETLARLPAQAVRELKGLVAGPARDGLQAQLAREKAAFLRCAASADFAERVAAFASRNPSTSPSATPTPP